MANTYSDYTATSGQTDFAFTFPYLKDTHVIVSIDGTETDINDTGAGSFTIVTSPSTLVRLDSGATAGASVRVKRNSLGKSNTEPALVDYNDGSVLTEKDLDDAYLHNFYLSQEAVEGAAGGLGMDTTVTSWDANNKKIINVGDPTNTKDAANKTYVDTQINNTVTGSTTEAQKWTFTGDNTATEFTFSPAITLDADTAYTVAIDGVMQEPTTAYTIDADNDTITFTSAPPTSSNIVVIARGYSVPVTEGAGTVTSVTAGNGLSGGTITSTGTIAIPTSGGTLNIDSGKVGIGGDADSTYHTKITGDVLIKEDSDTNTVLTLENAHASGGLSTLILYAHTPVIQFNDKNAATNKKKFNLIGNEGVLQLTALNDDGSTVATPFSFYHDGNVKLDSLPTSDPSTTGYLWNDGGVVRVSGSSGYSGAGDTLTLGTKQTLSNNSGSNYIEFTGIPAGVKQIYIMVDNLSPGGLDGAFMQIGDSGGYETSGYASAPYDLGVIDRATKWQICPAKGTGSDLIYGIVTITRIDDYTWVYSSSLSRDDSSGGYPYSGSKTLSGTLDRIRIPVNSVSGTCDGINISYI